MSRYAKQVPAEVYEISRAREKMPSLAELSRAWEAVGPETLRDVFPDNKAPLIGWGEPFCFRCGWLAPVDVAEFKGGRAIDRAWNAAGGWLERAHLQDHACGGEEDAWNLVPLCVVCHDQQPECRTRDVGVEFVNSAPRFQQLVWIVQMFTDDLYWGRRRPGRAKALRALLRVHAEAGAIYAQHHAAAA